MPKNTARTSHFFNFISALLAFIIWGGWAYYVNSNGGEDFDKGLISGVTQGTASFTITLIMVRLVAFFFNRLPRNFLQLPMAALLTVSVTGCGLAGIHVLVHTPKIFYTIAPALLVGFVFNWYTAYKLRKIDVQSQTIKTERRRFKNRRVKKCHRQRKR